MRNAPKPIQIIGLPTRFPVEKRTIEVTEQTATIVNSLFNRLKAASPAWKAAFTPPELEALAKRDWIKVFAKEGIVNESQIELGIKKRSEWPEPWFPSVGQFLAWCKPTLSDYGLPPVDEALTIVIRGGKRRHPVLFVAAINTGRRALTTYSHKMLLPIFTRNYEIACRRYINGEDLTKEIPKALPPKVLVVTPPDQVAKNAEKIRELLEQEGR